MPRSLPPDREGKRRKAARLRTEVRALAEAAGVELEESGTRRPRAQLFPRDGRRVVVVPPIRGMSSYLVALHELGHHLGRRAMRGTRLVREAAAWSWAISNATAPPTYGARRSALKALYGYGIWVADRQHRRRPPLMPGPDFDAAVAQIVGRSPRLRDLARGLDRELQERAVAARNARSARARRR